jgi:FixJ family two-component response regulator
VVAILLTAQADIQMALTAINEGRLHRFFTKPWDGVELRGALRKLLYLPAETPAQGALKARADEARLRETMAPPRDANGAWVIETPEGLAS